MNKCLKIIIPAILALLLIPSILRVSAADMSDLSLTREEVAAALSDSGTYTAASFAAFSTAVDGLGGLVGIDAIIAENTADQADVDQLDADLRAALARLVTQAAMDDLIEANNDAITAYYQDREFYTASSHAAFREAVAAYGGYLTMNALIADSQTTPEEVAAGESVIRSALALLESRADTTILEDAYDQAAELDLTPYTPASMTAFTDELERIRLIMISDDTTQEEADQALADLAAATDLLIPFAVKTALVSLLADAEAIRSEKFTVTSYYVLAREVEDAQTLENDPDALQSEVDQAVSELQSAMDDLVPVPGEIELTVGETGFDVNDYVTLGDSSAIGYVSSNPQVATVDASGNVVPVGFGTTEITVSLANGVEEVVSVFVKEKIKLLTILLISGVPLISTGLAVGLILTRRRPEKNVTIVRETIRKVPKTRSHKSKTESAGKNSPAKS